MIARGRDEAVERTAKLGAVIAIAALIGGAAYLAWGSIQLDNGNPSGRTTVESAVTTGSTQIHGTGIDLLDDDAVPGIPMADALEKLSWTPSLPGEELAGRPVKIVVNDMGDKPLSLMVQYDSGIKLFVRPGETDFAAELKKYGPPSGGLPESAMTEVAGRATLVNPGGGVNPSDGKRRNAAVDPVVSWSMRGQTYSLRSSSPSVTVGLLRRVAAEMR